MFQAVVMTAGFMCITIKGCIDIGGMGKMWEICEDNGRIDFVQFVDLFTFCLPFVDIADKWYFLLLLIAYTDNFYKLEHINFFLL